MLHANDMRVTHAGVLTGRHTVLGRPGPSARSVAADTSLCSSSSRRSWVIRARLSPSAVCSARSEGLACPRSSSSAMTIRCGRPSRDAASSSAARPRSPASGSRSYTTASLSARMAARGFPTALATSSRVRDAASGSRNSSNRPRSSLDIGSTSMITSKKASAGGLAPSAAHGRPPPPPSCGEAARGRRGDGRRGRISRPRCLTRRPRQPFSALLRAPSARRRGAANDRRAARRQRKVGPRSSRLTPPAAAAPRR